MLDKPTYLDIYGIKFPINYDFKTAIKCNQILSDNSIGENERQLAIIYLLYGDNGLNHLEFREQLLDKAIWFISCGKSVEESYSKEQEPDIDYIQDMDYIEASFMSDFHISLEDNKSMHWWKFYNLLGGLSNSEMGNCCVLNRIRNIRNKELSDCSDIKEKTKLKELKEQFAIKKQPKEKQYTEEQIKNMELFNQLVKGE